MRKLTLISGLPRSGSTLLCNLVNSNPQFHSTPTSGVIDVLKNMRSTMSHNVSFKTQNRLELMGNIQYGLRGFLEGYFHDKQVVFDKCRGWSNNIQLLDTILGHSDTKIIWTYRNPVEVVNSIEAQYQKTILLENVDEANAPAAFMTLDRRIGTYMGEGGLISHPIEILRDALEMGYGDRIFFVSYYDLCNHTQQVMDLIHDFIGEEKYEYDTKNLKQTVHEYDGIYNYKFMHRIREGEIKYSETKMILPQKYIDIVSQRYAPLNNFILNGDIEGFLNIILPKYEEPLETRQENRQNNPNKSNNPFIIDR
jgi:sulfotransferase